MCMDTDRAYISRVAAEMRAAEVVRALRHAVDGAPHWRFEAKKLLQLIDAGVLPKKPKLEHAA